MNSRSVRALVLVSISLFGAAVVGCGGGRGAKSANGAEDEAVVAVRKRASFDLGCAEKDIQVQQLQEGSMMTAASYGATCGDKRASYIERMGTVIKQ